MTLPTPLRHLPLVVPGADEAPLGSYYHLLELRWVQVAQYYVKTGDGWVEVGNEEAFLTHLATEFVRNCSLENCSFSSARRSTIRGNGRLMNLVIHLQINPDSATRQDVYPRRGR